MTNLITVRAGHSITNQDSEPGLCGRKSSDGSVSIVINRLTQSVQGASCDEERSSCFITLQCFLQLVNHIVAVKTFWHVISNLRASLSFLKTRTQNGYEITIPYTGFMAHVGCHIYILLWIYNVKSSQYSRVYNFKE